MTDKNEYEVITPSGIRLQWFAYTHVQARKEAEEMGHKVKAVALKRTSEPTLTDIVGEEGIEDMNARW